MPVRLLLYQEDYERVAAAAKKADLDPAVWMRRTVLAAAKKAGKRRTS